MKKVYLIGAGPGDPELITLKAVRALGESDAVLYDHLINPELLRYCKDHTEFIFVGKSKGDHTLPQDDINKLIVELTSKYDTVSRVKGGDPYIFGRGGEEFEYVLNQGIYCEVIPGITSASGASTSCHIPLTHRLCIRGNFYYRS
ncbi:MAG: uroporphyrinogen-III C-methyltransferase [Spirochaetia bacterium]|nr:uroporphyrinogen-III C-methyltransferase [Spirochaetia bacterium]